MDWKTVITRAQVKHALTQPQIAALVGCSQACISDLVRGRVPDPRYSVGQRLLDLSMAKSLGRQHLTPKPRTPKPQTPATAGEASHA